MRHLNHYTIAGLAVLFFFVGALFGKFKYKSLKHEQEDITYEMPRPHNNRWTLDLSGRQVNRTIKEAFQRNAKPQTPGAHPIMPKTQPTEQKKTAGKKSDKKANSTAETTKSAKLEMTIVEKSPSGLSQSEGWGSSDNHGGGSPFQKLEPTEKSYEEWRNLILATLSVVTVNEFLAEYNAHHVDPNSFYRVIEDLLADSRDRAQLLGLYILNAVPNGRSFIMTAQASYLLQGEPRLQAARVLLSYAQKARVPYIELGLQSDDRIVVKKATEVLMIALRNTKTSVAATSIDNRTRRGNLIAQTLSSQDTTFTRFIPYLQRIMDLGDSTLAPLASSALNQLQQVQTLQESDPTPDEIRASRRG